MEMQVSPFRHFYSFKMEGFGGWGLTIYIMTIMEEGAPDASDT